MLKETPGSTSFKFPKEGIMGGYEMETGFFSEVRVIFIPHKGQNG